MAQLLRIVLGIHILAGTVALLVFWVPLVTKKGGRVHRSVGWVYVTAAATVALSALVLSGQLMGDGNPRHFRSGFFLGYVGVFAAENALLGIFALRARNALGVAGRAALVVGPLLLAAGAIPLVILGATRARPLFIIFALLGVAQGVAHLRVVLSPPINPRERALAHMGAMGTSCITTLTAFVVVNAPRLGMRTFDFRLWAVPIVFLGIGLTLLRRYYANVL